MPLLRRSGRASLSRKKYIDDVSAEIKALFSSDSEINSTTGSDEAEDDEFDEQDAVAAAEDEQDLEENESGLEGGHSSADESVGDADVDFDDDVVDFRIPSG